MSSFYDCMAKNNSQKNIGLFSESLSLTAICVQPQTANISSRLFTFETARLPFQTARFPLET